MKEKPNILLIGPAPLNVGGVSTHLKRLMRLLADDYRFDFIDEGRRRFAEYFNLRSLNAWTYLRKIRHARLVHIHSGPPLLRIVNVLAAKFLCRRPTIVTVHRDITTEQHLGITARVLKLCDMVVTVNEKSAHALQQRGVKNVCTHPAFLPPDVQQEPQLPDDVQQWIDQRKHQPLIVANASTLITLPNGEDIYGVDMGLRLIKNLNSSLAQEKTPHSSLLTPNSNEVNLIFVIVTSALQPELMQQYRDFVVEHHLQDNILLYEGSLSFVRLMTQATIVLRPTNAEGDAITVREALWFGKPCVASDAAIRPEGTITFVSRNDQDLLNVVTRVLQAPKQTVYADTTDYHKRYTDLYNPFLTSKSK